jgi:hypothetical protein
LLRPLFVSLREDGVPLCDACVVRGREVG